MKKTTALILSLVLLAACVPLSLGAADTLQGATATYNAGAQLARSAGTRKCGDLNNDGKINVRDLGVMQQYINGWDVTVDKEVADLNSDGKVNVRDLGVMQQYINGWDVVLPELKDPTEPTTPPTEPTESTTPSTEPTAPTESTTPSTEPTVSTESTTPSTEPTKPTEPTNPPIATDAAIYIESVSVNKGAAEATVNVRVLNNPGIMTATLTVTVDDQVFGFKSASKTGYDSLFLTYPGNKQTTSPYNFLLDGMELTDEDKVDGTLFTITFSIKDTTVTGEYAVRLSYVEGDITDENYGVLDMAVEDGTITIK